MNFDPDIQNGNTGSRTMQGQIILKKQKGWPGLKREKHPCWKGGRLIDTDGYIRIYAADHFVIRKGGYHLEHRLVMERYLNRPLEKNECVHHKNHNRQDNRLENLEIIDRRLHSMHHRKLDAYRFKRDSKGRYVDLSY
jgi:hypothetical protein